MSSLVKCKEGSKESKNMDHATLTSKISRDLPGFISSVVLVEVCWVLARLYTLKKEAVMLVVNTH